jgi:uracil-DNA glycosylase family 4
VPDPLQTRAEALLVLRRQALGCVRCPKLAASRTQVVFGSGPLDAAVMFVGEAPGGEEDRDGLPLAGASARLLDELLAGIGLSRDAVAVVNAVNCRPPDNRNPLPGEVEHCRDYLHGQIALREPVVVCPLGSFATRVLRGTAEPVSVRRGRPEVRTVGARAVRLLPLLHPAAALYADGGVAQLRADMALIPDLVALGAPEQPPVPQAITDEPPAVGPQPAVVPVLALRPPPPPDDDRGPVPEPEPEPGLELEPEHDSEPVGEQLGLF